MSPLSLAEHRYPTNEDLAAPLAAAVAAELDAAIAAHGHAVLAVSGGRSPVPVFAALRDTALAWDKVTITLVDERWVPETDPASNAALVRAHLLKGAAAAATFIPMYNGADSAEAGESALNAVYATLPMPFAAVILGMGDDGHTASLFPASPALQAGLDLKEPRACLTQVGAVAPTARMSLTLAAILNSRRVFLQFGGAAKVTVYQAARLAISNQYPVSHVLHQSQTPVEVFYAD